MPRGKQTPSQELSSNLNWLVYQLKGASGNLNHPYRYFKTSHLMLLDDEDRRTLERLNDAIIVVTKRLDSLAEEIAFFNKTKKKLFNPAGVDV